MTEIKDNIKRLRTESGLSQDQLAEKLGKTRSAISQYEAGKIIPRMGVIEDLAKVFGVMKSEIIGETQIAFVDRLPVRGMEMASVPLRGRVHAGALTDSEDLSERGQAVEIPRFLLESDPDCYACESEGDCMNRVYPTGCIIVVSPNKQPQNGSVAVVDVEGLGTVMRRMYRTAHTLVLSPDSFNPEHEDVVVTADDDRQVTFGGRVVWYQAIEEME